MDEDEVKRRLTHYLVQRGDMGSNEENKLSNGDVGVHRDVEWAKYGLHDPEAQRNAKRSDNEGNNNAFDPEMYQTGANELFAQEYVSVRSSRSIMCVTI